MKKKSIVLAATALMMAAALVVGGTLAYFTDTDEATNTFTAGGVKIDLIEQERDGKGGLQDFTQDQVLMPIVGSAQGEKDELGQPTAANYIDKIVTIENTGKSDAWIRAYFAIPAALDDGPDTFNAGLNILHFNFGNYEGTTTFGKEWIWKNAEGDWNCFVTEIEGVSYNVYYADYAEIVPAEGITKQFISGVYLDKSFDQETDANGDVTYKAFGKGIDLSGLVGEDGELVINCPVKAVAVQADGFNSAAAAVTEAFGANFNPFAA